MYPWKFNSKLRMFKVKRSDPGEGLLMCTGFLWGMMKMFKNWLDWHFHNSVYVLRSIAFYTLKEPIVWLQLSVTRIHTYPVLFVLF